MGTLFKPPGNVCVFFGGGGGWGWGIVYLCLYVCKCMYIAALNVYVTKCMHACMYVGAFDQIFAHTAVQHSAVCVCVCGRVFECLLLCMSYL